MDCETCVIRKLSLFGFTRITQSNNNIVCVAPYTLHRSYQYQVAKGGSCGRDTKNCSIHIPILYYSSIHLKITSKLLRKYFLFRLEQ